jgi:hypothetical protein
MISHCERRLSRSKFLIFCFSDKVFTPKALAIFSPGFSTLGVMVSRSSDTPKVLGNACGVTNQQSLLALIVPLAAVLQFLA